jgi:hypothetical protein
MMTLAQLAKICRIDRDPHHLTGAPRRGGGKTFATDGSCLLVVDGEIEEAAEYEKPGEIFKIIPNVPPAHHTTVGDLRAWTRVALPCPDCGNNGSRVCTSCLGKRERPCECPRCHEYHVAACSICEDGVEVCRTCAPSFSDDVPGRVLGAPFSARRIAWVLRDIPDGPCTIALDRIPLAHERRPGAVLLIAGDGWRAIVMELRVLDDHTDYLPPFPDLERAAEQLGLGR